MRHHLESPYCKPPCYIACSGLLDGMKKKSESSWCCPVRSPLLRKCLPLTFSQLSGWGSGGKLIRDAKPDLSSEWMSAHTPCNYAGAVLKGYIGWRQITPNDAKQGKQIPCFTETKSQENTGQLSLLSVAILHCFLLIGEVWIGHWISMLLLGPFTCGCIFARSFAVTIHHPKLVIHVLCCDFEESTGRTRTSGEWPGLPIGIPGSRPWGQ